MKHLPHLLIALLSSSALAATPATLREAAGDKLQIGAAVSVPDLTDPAASALLAGQFNSMTAGNDFKPDALHPAPGTFRFDTADKYVAFAKAHDMKMVGHNLVWHSQTPAFLFQSADGQPLPREQALANLKEHITTIVTHFKGQLVGWDVVNEGIDDAGPYLRPTPAFKAIGEDYIQKAFEFAHEADPDVQLYYNDYNIEKSYKKPKALRLLKALKDANVPIYGVGIQAHCQLGDKNHPKEIDAAIADFSAMGLKVMITELDVDVLPRKTSGADVNAREQAADPYKAGLPQNIADAQGAYYEEIFKLARKYPDALTRITLWGTDDGTSWLNDWPVKGRTNYGMLWYRDRSPKPAFAGALAGLTGN